MTKVFIFAGQSNAQGYGPYIQLDPVPSYAQTAANGWTGAPTVSSDQPNTQYERPYPEVLGQTQGLTLLPYLYMENNSGEPADNPNAFGPYVGCDAAGIPFHPGEQSLYGPEVSFLWKYQADHPNDQVAVLKYVLGGSGDKDWLPPNAQSVGGNADGSAGLQWTGLTAMIQTAVSLLQAQGQTAEWAGFLWMQGENGASSVYPYLYPTRGQEYSDQIRFLFAALRQLTSPNLPIALGRISNSMEAPGIINALPTTYTPAQYIAATEYRRAQQVLVGSDPGNAWWDDDNLPVRTSDPPANQYHFTGAGYLAMGERSYGAWKQASGYVPPPPPPPLVVTFNGTPEAWVVQLNGTVIGKAGDTISITG